MALWLHWCFSSPTLLLAKYFKEAVLIKSINLINFQPQILKILLANINCRYAARLNSCTPS